MEGVSYHIRHRDGRWLKKAEIVAEAIEPPGIFSDVATASSFRWGGSAVWGLGPQETVGLKTRQEAESLARFIRQIEPGSDAGVKELP